MLKRIAFLILVTSVTSCTHKAPEGPAYPEIVSVHTVRANAGALSNKIVNIYGHLSRIAEEGNRVRYLLLPSSSEAELSDSQKKQVGILVNLWDGADLSKCVNAPVSVTGTYYVEEFRNPNAFFFDSIQAEIIRDNRLDTLCGMTMVPMETDSSD